MCNRHVQLYNHVFGMLATRQATTTQIYSNWESKLCPKCFKKHIKHNIKLNARPT